MIGTALVARLEARGDRCVRLGRPGAAARWDRDLAGAEAVVHLAGENIGARRWSASRRAEILGSRARGTAAIADAVAAMSPRPRVLVSASAIGVYGDRGSEELTEQSGPGTGFLAEVCRAWESAAGAADAAGVRTVLLRTGIVQSAADGALARQLPLFRLGLGGPLGPGTQYVSWISLADEVGAIVHAIDSADVAGPLNAVAPHPATARDYARALGRALGRPAALRVPASALRVALGRQMADELLLSSQRVVPEVLLTSGYEFVHPDLDECLRAILKPPPARP
jgi:hypothetical protein